VQLVQYCQIIYSARRAFRSPDLAAMEGLTRQLHDVVQGAILAGPNVAAGLLIAGSKFLLVCAW
jgi:hypothetical protein